MNYNGHMSTGEQLEYKYAWQIKESVEIVLGLVWYTIDVFVYWWYYITRDDDDVDYEGETKFGATLNTRRSVSREENHKVCRGYHVFHYWKGRRD